MIDLAVFTWVDFAGGKEISQYNFSRVTSCVPLPQERGHPDPIGGSCGILALPPYSGRGAPSSPGSAPVSAVYHHLVAVGGTTLKPTAQP